MPPAETRVAPGSVGAALAESVARLRSSGSPSARLDAELLVAHVRERDRAWLLAHLDAPMAAGDADRVAELVSRRSRGEPIAYIRGFKEWYGLRLRTDRRALIPRPETELLVEAAIGELVDRLGRDDRPILVWDVGTGSGAVAVALGRRFRAALALGRMRLVASDLSADAVELAAENLALHGLDRVVSLAVADLLDPIGPADPADLVVANLPYVRSDEVAAGEGSLAWEPTLALDGGADGLDAIGALVGRLPRRLAADGTALLEIGVGQVDGVRALAGGLPGDWTVESLRDLAGHERVIRIERR